MPSPDRSLAVALAAGLALFAAGCGGSHNKGRIEGKWAFVATGEPDAPPRDAALVFGDDGTVVLERPGDPPASTGDGPRTPAWRYKLLAGNAADFYGLPADASERFGLFRTDTGRARVTIAIEVAPGGKYERRTMTLTDADGRTLRLILTR
jgi:hypothetical protein